MPYKNKKSEKAVLSHKRCVAKYNNSLRGKFAVRFNNMKARLKPSSKDYKFYKNITTEWKTIKDFEKDMWNSFVLFSKKEGIKNTTIDRINPKGNYTKENCRWATRQTQSKNRKDTLFITIGGEKLCLTEAALRLNTTRGKLYRKLYGSKKSL